MAENVGVQLDLVANIFAREINDRLQEFFETHRNYVEVKVSENRVVVSTPGGGINLEVESEPKYRLSLHYRCTLSSSGKHLAIESSSMKIFELEVGEPILHYDFERSPGPYVPAAHFNVHLTTPELLSAMKNAGENKVTRKRRVRRFGDGHGLPADLHLPLGGPRFRPALEDILQFLKTEFAIDSAKNWTSTIREGRAVYRDKQLRAAVSDNPTAAIEELEAMGFSVSSIESSKKRTIRPERLEQY